MESQVQTSKSIKLQATHRVEQFKTVIASLLKCQFCIYKLTNSSTLLSCLLNELFLLD